MTHQSRTQNEGRPSMDDIDAEFFRMINDEQLRNTADVRARIWRGSPC